MPFSFAYYIVSRGYYRWVCTCCYAREICQTA